jgi:hypothetical protein
MRYQDCVEAVQAAEEADGAYEARLAAANINPATGLASDYLNHFYEDSFRLCCRVARIAA